MFDLFILGAGFSTMSGAPKEKEILPKIFQDPNNTELFSSIIRILYHKHPSWLENTSFNEILSRLDLIRYYKPYPNLNYDLVENTERQLLKKMVLLLEPKQTKLNTHLYQEFIKKANQASFISFNYDLILEKALQSSELVYRCGLPTRDLDNPMEVNEDIGTRYLLKLHGSIDLLFCSNCRVIFRTKNIRNTDVLCPLCSERFLNYFLIAPTLFKSYRMPALRNLWYSALQILAKCKTLCFIGYSMPDGDILSYQLFDTAFRMANMRQRAYLINGPRHNPEKFFEIYGNNLVNTKMYLQDWINSLQ